MPEAINLSEDGQQLRYGSNKEDVARVIDTNSEKVLVSFSGFNFP